MEADEIDNSRDRTAGSVDRQPASQPARETVTDRKPASQPDRQPARETVTDSKPANQPDSQLERQSQTASQPTNQPARQTDRQPDRQPARQTDKQTDRPCSQRQSRACTDLGVKEAEEEGDEESLEGVEEHLHVDLEQVGDRTQSVRQPDEAHVVHGEQRDQDQGGLGQLPVDTDTQHD